jgi:hypothetical protein
MIRFRVLALLSALLLVGQAGASAEATSEMPDFKEIYDTIAAHGAVSSAELNRAAVQGLLEVLGPKASLVMSGAGTAGTNGTGSSLNKVTVFDDGIAYFRIGQVGGDLAPALMRSFRQINATNAVHGVVLDLRYSAGENYTAAAETTDLFVSKAEPLLDAGGGVISSHDKTNALRAPVAIIVNHNTARAAEALAAMLRDLGTGLIIGNRTAGEALMAQEFPLKNGDRLRVATGPMKLGDGTVLSTNGVKPDIEVSITPEEERAYYADAFLVRTNTGSMSSTNQAAETRRVRLNEAELVREHKEGLSPDAEDAATVRPLKPNVPVVNDPALARALDLLKGLAVVRGVRP